MKNSLLVICLFFLITVSACSNTASGNEAGDNSDYPNKSIEVIVPYDAGGGTDIIARAIANVISEYLPNEQSMVIVNKPGGTGVVGATEVFHADPDGYKLGLFVNSALAIQPHLTETVYSYDEFEAVNRISINPQLFFVQGDSPWNSLEDIMVEAIENPGTISLGTSGSGGTGHLSIEALSSEVGADFKLVHFDGTGPALTALMGGHVDGVVLPPNSSTSEVEPLAVIGKNRTQLFEGVPSTSELGYNASVETFSAIVAPPGTPNAIIETLNSAFEQALEDPLVQEQILNIGGDAAYVGSDELEQYIEESFNMNGELLKQIGLSN